MNGNLALDGRGVANIELSKIDTADLLSNMVGYRDDSSGQHMKRTAEITHALVDCLSENSYYKTQLTILRCELIVAAAKIHDIGKIAIPDSILLKRNELTAKEQETMRTHCQVGADMLDSIVSQLDPIAYECFYEVCLYHHEWWNGGGYPFGISGRDIPLSARIVAVADVYDALVSERSYKKPFDRAKALTIISKEAGRQFDPDIIAVLFKTPLDLDISEVL